MPRVKTTRTVKVALLLLRIYLILLVALVVVKFIRTFWPHSPG
jgi:hypothetical protein